MQSGAYRAPPVRRVEIPKPDGGTRPLGVAALEDKIVQKAVTEIILTPIYEPIFLGFSYGFRPGRGAHDALDALAVAIDRHKINWVIDCYTQRGRFNWQQLTALVDRYWPKPRIWRPWPGARLAVKHPRKEPDALTRTSGSARRALSNQRPYRDTAGSGCPRKNAGQRQNERSAKSEEAPGQAENPLRQ